MTAAPFARASATCFAVLCFVPRFDVDPFGSVMKNGSPDVEYSTFLVYCVVSDRQLGNICNVLLGVASCESFTEIYL